ncbi:MAG: glutamate synthase [Candidatus Handelsmanbacteria bacterium]|nr:glutamate synthase [Candidatus Handelsmanbacteria bacterium]
MAEIDCQGRTTRQINAAIKEFIAQGESQVLLHNPAARHNLGVGIVQSARLEFAGSVGYFCAGMSAGPTVEIQGSAGWGLAESMMEGRVVVRGSAGNGAAASVRGGTVVIHGDAAARLGVSLKGGLVLVGGSCGYMAGFMAQKGTLVVCGDVGEAFADSMYEATCFVGGRIGDLGNDAVIKEPTARERAKLEALLSEHLPGRPNPDFKKVVSGRKLWNFNKQERALWREAL